MFRWHSHTEVGAGHFGAAVSAPPFERHCLGADRFGAGTSRCWHMSAPAVTAGDVSALALYVAAAATLHSDTLDTEKSTYFFSQMTFGAWRHFYNWLSEICLSYTAWFSVYVLTQCPNIAIYHKWRNNTVLIQTASYRKPCCHRETVQCRCKFRHSVSHYRHSSCKCCIGSWPQTGKSSTWFGVSHTWSITLSSWSTGMTMSKA